MNNQQVTVSVPFNNAEMLEEAATFLEKCAIVARNLPTQSALHVAHGMPEGQVLGSHNHNSDTPEGSDTSAPVEGGSAAEQLQQELDQGSEVPHGDDSGDLDAEGRPWDERIDGSGKTFLAKANKLGAAGTWTPRRKPKEMNEAEWLEYHAKIKAELIDRPQMPEGGEPQGEAPNAAEAFGQQPQGQPSAAEAFGQQPQGQAPEQPAAQPQAVDAQSIIDRMSAAASNPQIGVNKVMPLLTQVGIPNMPAISQQTPEKLAELANLLSFHGI